MAIKRRPAHSEAKPINPADVTCAICTSTKHTPKECPSYEAFLHGQGGWQRVSGEDR